MSGASIPRPAPEPPAPPRLIDAHAHLDESGIERAIVHWYAGPLDALDGFIRHGAYFTVGVEVFTSRHIQEIARG